MRDCAVQIIKCDKNKINFDLDAFKVIVGRAPSTMNVAVYCISGKFRTGKSFLMGLLLHYLINGESDDWLQTKPRQAFKYKISSSGVTSGLWMWSEPVIKKDSNGHDVTVFLMDSHGWHDDKTPKNLCRLIFSLSTILSSVMLFNVMGHIGEDDLGNLQSYTTDAIQLNSRKSGKKLNQLMFLLRDWTATCDHSHGYSNGDDQDGFTNKQTNGWKRSH